ncbi:MAG: hypothetical protein KBF73_10985 [Flavobacteriales bacterium]|nr:hypothetical protein [Flavobacteriales bacterium]
MKTKNLLLILVAMAACVQTGFAQINAASSNIQPSAIKDTSDLKLTTDVYINDVNAHNITKKLEKFEKSDYNYYNNKMLNVLFREEVGSIVHNSTDATANRWYATLGNEDELLSFGGTFGTSKDKTKKLTHLFSLGASLKSANGFATIAKDGELVSGINGTVKYTWVGRGIINYGDGKNGKHGKNGLKMEAYRVGFLKTKMDKEIAEYVKKDGEFDKWKEVNEIDNDMKATVNDKKELKLLQNQYLEYYEKMAVNEVETLKEHDWYKFLWDHWVTIDGSFPISEKKYELSKALSDTATTDEKYYAFKVSVNYTSMWKFRNDMSVYLSGRAKFYNNNNIAMKELDSDSYRTMTLQSLTNVAVTDEKDVYVGQYDQFLSGAFELEAVYFIRKWFGVSGSVEYTVGPRSTFNWKVGIPFSLRDKDDKPTVNFELQYKELNNHRLVGIRVGFILGKYVG